MTIDVRKTRGGRILHAGGVAFLGLVILLFNEVWYHAADPARQTHETAGAPGFKERVELTDARRAQIRETQSGYRLLFSAARAVVALVGAGMFLASIP